jgi:hypothetical protein
MKLAVPTSAAALLIDPFVLPFEQAGRRSAPGLLAIMGQVAGAV